MSVNREESLRPPHVAQQLLQEAEQGSRTFRHRSYVLRLSQLVVGASISVLAVAEASALILAILGAAIVVAQGIDEIFQWRSRSVILNDTLQDLRDEQLLWASRAGPYGDSQDPDRLLAERLINIRSRTTAAYREAFRTSPGATQIRR